MAAIIARMVKQKENYYFLLKMSIEVNISEIEIDFVEFQTAANRERINRLAEGKEVIFCLNDEILFLFL